MNQSILRKFLWPAGAIVLFLVLNMVYFSPQLQGKVLRMSDLQQFKGMAQEARAYEAQTGETALWTNGMFSGMPTYQLTAPQKNNTLKIVRKFFMGFFSGPIGFFFAAMVSMYILLLILGAGHGISIIGAIAFGLTTNGMVLFTTGHTSKFMALAFSPMIIGGMLLVFKEKWIPGLALFSLGLGLNILSNHVQMTYYLFLVLGIIGLFELIRHAKAGTLPVFGKAVAILILGVVLALGSSASKIWTTYEYSRDTMRGKPILETKSSVDANSSSETEGLAWDYAMQWSNGFGDLAAGLVPRAVGGSGQEVVKDSETIKRMRSAGIGVREGTPQPLYWGDLPFTSGPVYFGALMCFLFVLAFFVSKGPLKWAILAGTLLTILMSLGKHLSGFNQLLFDYLPLLNKFRAPSSILSVTAILIPFLSALGLKEFLDHKENGSDRMKAVVWAGGITAALWVIIAFVMPSMSDFIANSDPAYAQQGWNTDALRLDRKSALQADSFRSLLYIILGVAALFAYLKNWIKKPILLLAIGLFIVADVWGVGKRYISQSDFLDSKQVETFFSPRPCDTEILKDGDLHYRVHDLTVDPFNSSRTSYFHKTIGGYHAAKLQRYQDMIERYISKGDMNVLNMLNTKYFITNDAQGQAIPRRNASALGNAWFVENIEIKESADAEIGAMQDFDPAETAFIHKEFQDVVSGFDPSKNGTIQLQSYTPNKLTYQSNTTSEQLAVFSEVWYGPDKGWELRIDGEPARLIRANYILRAARIPAGEHTIEMEFSPKKYLLGEWISLVASVLIIALVGYGLFLGYRKMESEKPTAIQTPESAKSRKRKPRKKK